MLHKRKREDWWQARAAKSPLRLSPTSTPILNSDSQLSTPVCRSPFQSTYWWRGGGKGIPANSHALSVSLTPAGQFLTPDWKNVSCCHLAWHNFQKYVNADPCKERKPCEKWINDNTFIEISDFWSEKHWERACIYTRRKTSEDFRRLRKTSDFFGKLRKWSCCLQKSLHSQDKNLTLTSRKKLAGIEGVGVRWRERNWGVLPGVLYV